MKSKIVGWFFMVTGLFATGAWAQAISKDEAQKIWEQAKVASQKGPTSIALAGQGSINLPAGQVYVPQPHATQVLHVMGNPGSDPRLQGIVFPENGAPWFITIRFEPAGYVKDDDAKDWNADDLLKSYKEVTEASNAEREKMGVPGLEILGWAEKPAYDSKTHRLAWAMSSRQIGAPTAEPQGVNYNTYALGRDGYFSLNLVTDLNELAQYKPEAHGLLDALQFSDGKRYADFNSKTDKVAEYGLAALVVGVAAKKLGLFAVIAVFLAKFAKIIAIAAFAFGGAVLNWFRKKPDAKSATHAAIATSELTPAVKSDTPPQPPAST